MSDAVSDFWILWNIYPQWEKMSLEGKRAFLSYFSFLRISPRLLRLTSGCSEIQIPAPQQQLSSMSHQQFTEHFNSILTVYVNYIPRVRELTHKYFNLSMDSVKTLSEIPVYAAKEYLFLDKLLIGGSDKYLNILKYSKSVLKDMRDW
jgi:hypothetical protein